jgi:hypothetical protein
MAHTIKQRITPRSLLERLGDGSFGSYYNRRLVRWAGHAAPRPQTSGRVRTREALAFSALDGQQLLGGLSLVDGEGLSGHVDIGCCMAAHSHHLDLRQPVRACGCCGEAEMPSTPHDSGSRGILSSW